MTVEEMIRNSQCFGVAYDEHVPECKTCDVKMKCDAKCRAAWNVSNSKPAPTIVAEVAEITTKAEPAKSQSKAKKPVKSPTPTTKNYSPDMPEFKGITIEELEKMAVERGINLDDFTKFTAPNIRRMRITMALKATYEI